MSIIEPPLKKMKLQIDNNLLLENLDSYIEAINASSKPLKIIIADDIFSTVPSTKVYIGHIKEPSRISSTIQLLNEKMPLKALQHLKRVRGRDIIICPIQFLSSTLSIEKYLEQNVPELTDVFEYCKEVPVALHPPKVTSQYKEANKMWSCNFHPDKYMESILNGTLFGNKELRYHRQFMVLTFEVAKWCISKHKLQNVTLEDINVAVVVDPKISSVVAVSVDNRLRHPLQHAAMVAIDNVAKTQNAGAWLSLEEKLESNRELSGIDKEIYSHLSKLFPDVKFGARPFEKLSVSESNDKDSHGPYLCTGYYIYLMREPCVMCSMGLIHARINRTFFCFDNKDSGALQSKTMLHLNPSLNHRFEAFTGFL